MIFLNSKPLRCAVCFALVLALFLTGIVRIIAIIGSDKITAAAESNSTVVTVSQLRGNIFDCNGIPLTGAVYKKYAVITPTPATIMYCSTVLYGDEKISVLGKLRNQKPAVIETDREMKCAGIINLEVPEHSPKNGFCAHLIGYTDSSGHGVSGLEKFCDDILYTDKKVTVRYAVSGNGEVLSGIEPQVNKYEEVSASGVMITVDNTVQTVIEKAAERLPKGAVAVSEVGTGKIRGILSRPNFDIYDLAASLESEDSPFLNRSLTGYNVGSIFKPCVAAAALENGKWNGFVTECTGSSEIAGNIFACHESQGHGSVGLDSAIIYSCNSYFYRLAQRVGAEDIIDIASVFGFGYKKTLGAGITTSGENLPDAKDLESSIDLANISIGQGKLLASPVTMLGLYEAIANGGVYHSPTLVEGTVKNGVLEAASDEPSAIKAMSEKTANRLKGYLTEVVINGTGKKAFSSIVNVAGKTATAETGWKEEGKATQHSWFCGFFPVDDPKYVVVVLVEDSAGKDSLAAEIFKEIAEGL